MRSFWFTIGRRRIKCLTEPDHCVLRHDAMLVLVPLFPDGLSRVEQFLSNCHYPLLLSGGFVACFVIVHSFA